MLHVIPRRPDRPFGFASQFIWRCFNKNFVRNQICLKLFSTCTMACQRGNVLVRPTEELAKETKWMRKTSFKIGTFNLLAPCYKTIEEGYMQIFSLE